MSFHVSLGGPPKSLHTGPVHLCDTCGDWFAEQVAEVDSIFSAPSAVGPALGADATSLSAKKGSATNRR